MESLLEKTRTINKMIRTTASTPVDFSLIVRILSDNISANVYLVGRRGKILAYHFIEGFLCKSMTDIILFSESFPETYNQRLLFVTETKENVQDQRNICFFHTSEKCPLVARKLTIIPIYGCGERLGSLILTRSGSDLDTSDLILAEQGATVVGTEILRIKTERVELDTRKKAAVQIALGTLSFSEIEAAETIFFELNSTEGVVVASRVADRVGITRSVIVNALRKLESAGVIEARSLGMKGTYIRILNENLFDELKKTKWKNKIR